ncbi:MAG TPA: hypothetical protein H9662_06275 [Firmicutes bacterium]|nr:hypothetical protein [Bacillota bacterium]
MKEIDLIYDRLPYPTEQFYSCIGGRLLCAFRYFQKDNSSVKLYPYLLLCNLQFIPLFEGEIPRKRFLEDPSYFRSVELKTPEGSELFSLRGIPFLNNYLKDYGMIFHARKGISKNTLLELVRSEFAQGNVVILRIDQFFHRKSEKYQKQKNAHHALLLKGIADSRRCVIASDSLYFNEYDIPYDELKNMSIGSMYTVCCHVQKTVLSMDLLGLLEALKKQNPGNSVIKPCFEELCRCLSECQGPVLKRILYGYVHNFKYVLLPYFRARKVLIQEIEKMSTETGELCRLCEEYRVLWEGFLLLLTRTANTGKGIGMLMKRINAIQQQELEIQKNLTQITL